jgi:hypothetical protein
MWKNSFQDLHIFWIFFSNEHINSDHQSWTISVRSDTLVCGHWSFGDLVLLELYLLTVGITETTVLQNWSIFGS